MKTKDFYKSKSSKLFTSALKDAISYASNPALNLYSDMTVFINVLD